MQNLIMYMVISAVLLTVGCRRPAPTSLQPPAAAPTDSPAPAELEPLESLTDAHTRVTWIRQVAGEATDPFATSNHFILMGLDTQDGRGERAILDTVDNYRKPLLSGDGERIVYTDLPELQMHVVNWDGSGRRRLGSGMSIELWQDPATGTEWVYYAETHLSNDTLDAVGLMRLELDHPEHHEMVWDQTHVTPDNFQLSADGTKAAGLFPWKQWSVLDLETMTLEPQGKGCWTSMAPDNSYRCWVFDGAHKNILLKRPGVRELQRIPLNRVPGVNGHEVYHPRWSNHPRFMAMTGPYTVMGRYNAITGGGKGVNLFVGRFNEDMTSMEAWSQITDDLAVDIFPDVWVAGAGISETTMGSPHLAPDPDVPTGTVTRLRITGRLAEITETPSLRDISPYKSTLVEYAYDVVSVLQGELDADRILVQHWGIRDSEYVELEQEIGALVTLTLEPVAAHPWLQGERVSGTIDEFLDLFLDVSQPPPSRTE